MLRFILSWSASSSDFATASLDVTAAFLNAPLPKGRIVVLRPPTVLYKLQLLQDSRLKTLSKVVSAYFEKSKNGPKITQKRLSQQLVQVCCASYLDQSLTQKNGNFDLFFNCSFLYLNFSLQKEECFCGKGK